MTKTVDLGLMGNQHKCKYWLHRISYEWDVSYALLAKGYLTLGWSDYCTSGIESKVHGERDIEVFESIMKELGETSRSRWNLFKFCSFRRGDYVVVPLSGGEFSIFRLTGSAMPISRVELANDTFVSESGETIRRGEDGLFYRESSQKAVDLGFAVEVEPVREHLSRYEYADNKLTARMKILQTNADISDLEKNVQAVINAQAPINFYAVMIEELAGKILDLIRTQLNPDKFEKLIRWYFLKTGATKAFIPAKNSRDKRDGADADLVAEFEPLKVIIYVQAKLHEQETGPWAVEQITKYWDQHESGVNEYIGIPWVITSADKFAPDAVLRASEHRVRLITGLEFARMLIDAGITDINKAFE